MLKNIYSPLSGAVAKERLLEVIANNMANVNTNGFKGDRVTFSLTRPEPNKNYHEPLPDANFKIDLESLMPLRGNDMKYVSLTEVHRDETQGPAVSTGNPLDFMIEGEGHFAVETQDGRRYTRNGSLSLNSDGVLTTKLGHPVMGERGDILLRQGDFSVNPAGEVFQDGQIVDRIQLFRFNGPGVERVGQNYLRYEGPQETIEVVDGSSIRQGYVEGSNVNAVKSLTDMIIAHRSYEAYAKAVAQYDKMMDKTSNQIGQVRG